MPRTIPAQLDGAHLKRLENCVPTMAKADLNFLEVSWKAQLGKAIDRAIAMANRTQKETWAALGHKEGSTLNRWISGDERPQFDALFAIEWLRQPLVIALAGLAGDGVEVTTQITLRKTA